MEAKFSQRVKDVISFSREEALRLGNDFIGVEHLLLGLIREGDGKAIVVLQEFHLDLNLLLLDFTLFTKLKCIVWNYARAGRDACRFDLFVDFHRRATCVCLTHI